MNRKFFRSGLVCAAAFAGVTFVAAAEAAADSCSDWIKEHAERRAEVENLYISGATPETLDSAVFEVLQLEIYLSACPISSAKRRAEHIGWRLMNRPYAEYAQIFVESLLERAGFAKDLDELAVDALAFRPSVERER